MTGPRIVVTNDDGIESPGLLAMADAMADLGTVVVAAPASDMSGAGTGIGKLDSHGVDMKRVDMSGYEAYTIAGPPGLAVMAVALGAFGGPAEMVVSGINAGINTGQSIIHSGTVGAALTARTFRMKGMAVSLAESDPWHWETAGAVAHSAARWLLSRSGLPPVLNVNVPGRPVGEIRGVHWADLDEFGYFRVANTEEEARRLQFTVSAASTGSDPASDSAICDKGFVAVTPISPISPAPFPDVDPSSIWPGDQEGRRHSAAR